MGKRLRIIAFGFATASALVGALPPGAAGASTTVRIAAAPRVPAGASLIGALAPSTPMRITVELQPRDPAALMQRAIGVSQPGSPLYRHYLTVPQFRALYAPTSATVAAVRASLRAHGLTAGPLTAGGMSLPVIADAGALQRAFSIVFDRIRLPSGASAIVNSLAPALDGNIAGSVEAVIGLNGLDRATPLLVRPSAPRGAGASSSAAPRARPHVVTGGPQPCGAASTAAPGQTAFTMDQIASAYDFSGDYTAGNEGAGATVAVYELEPYSAQDIAAYQSCYGTNAQISNVAVDGGAGSGPGTGEAAFDIEQVIGLAPKANIIVYTAANSNDNGPGAGPFDALQVAVDQNKAQVITDSWGQCEPMEGSADAHAEETLTEQATVQGQTIIAASGDEGSEGCSTGGALPDNTLAVGDPAAQPFVTGVGGTTLHSIGPPPGETVWNDGGGLTGLLGLALGASGGGISTFWPMPAYQSSANPALGVVQPGSSGRPCGAPSGDCRESPDVSADADPNSGYLIYWNGAGSVSGQPAGWQGSGGTSGSAPLWAALVAIADASKGCAGAPVGFINPALYALAGADYGRYFHDVTSGNNDLTGAHAGTYPARPGYDMATGLGSPDAAQLTAGLCATSLRITNPGRLSSSVGSRVDLRLAAAGVQVAGARYSAQGLPPGLHIAAGSGIVSGSPRRTGRYTVKAIASDGSGETRSTTFTWVIAGPPTLTAVSLTHAASGSARLAFQVVAARGGPALDALTVTVPARLAIGFGGSVAVTGAGGAALPISLSRRGATIVITLRSPSAVAGVSAALTLSSAYRGAVRRGRHPLLTVTVKAADVSGGTVSLRGGTRPTS